ncbi:unnamed protein product [Symbiodinium natans]|uniref:Nbr1-like C-terminal UBA domain-containing protein n=1 Tax=Symbiodinium natans TaxID=878477 RepID=A0A812PU59_9DINO|nr:unnamed protein product [Symbiodinium natans]
MFFPFSESKGVDPNDAATQAIQSVRQEMAQAAAPEVAMTAGGHEDQLQELRSMGFSDEERNRALLKKYAGRMDRVVEALCGS